MAPSYSRLIQQYGESNIKFVDIPITPDNDEVHSTSTLNVKTYPLGHIYFGGHKLEQRRLGRQQLADFSKIIKNYKDGSCQILDEETCKISYKAEYKEPIAFKKPSWSTR